MLPFLLLRVQPPILKVIFVDQKPTCCKDRRLEQQLFCKLSVSVYVLQNMHKIQNMQNMQNMQKVQNVQNMLNKKNMQNM